MNEIKIFENKEFGSLRTVEIDNEPWFVGKDVAEALGYSNASKAVIVHIDDEDKRFVMLDIADTQNGNLPVGQSKTAIINESGLYSLVLSSKLPTAKKFKRWVTSEVLPSIRRNGGYLSGQENMTPEELMAKALVYADKKIKEYDLRIAALTVDLEIARPKAEYFDELVDRNLLTNFRDTAKQLGIKQRKFIDFLLNKKYLYRDKHGKLMPYAQHTDNGLFELKECINEKTDWSGTQTLITPKGRETFRLLCIGA